MLLAAGVKSKLKTSSNAIAKVTNHDHILSKTDLSLTVAKKNVIYTKRAIIHFLHIGILWYR